ncbi:hypothetical protein [uncultured Flavobacterium sp.]|jgi:hypothetical protein|uniref:hypothetical protein n=1 Tax=uncultured Flavobacterium sp. TaxID=165435 RepID=UPI0030EDC50C|tara:strand:+ start:1382 stop:1669 length:288 start_codon:yes stop_codon:yes gene_type:complete
MKAEKIKSGIYIWGFYPALFLLKEEQENENYENCQEIKKALDEVDEGRDWKLNSKVDDDSMEETYNKIMEGLIKPELINSNMQHYIDEFRKYAVK